MTKLLFLATCLTCFFAQAQTLRFDDNGKVVQLPKKYDSTSISLDNLKTLSKVKVKEAKAFIIDQIEIAQDLLDDSLGGAYRFYELVWSNMSDFEKELQLFKTYIETDTPPAQALLLLKPLKEQYDADIRGLGNIYFVQRDTI